MSHYAQLVRELEVWVGVYDGNHARRLESGTEIRLVTPHGNATAFEALVKTAVGDEWLKCFTSEDLPAYTDRGRAHRDDNSLPVHPALARGRPPSEPTNALAVRLTRAQREWVSATAAKQCQSPSEYVRDALKGRGMPT